MYDHAYISWGAPNKGGNAGKAPDQYLNLFFIEICHSFVQVFRTNLLTNLRIPKRIVDYFTNTIERIFYFAKSKGISINKLSLEIGVSNSYFNKMFKKKASVGSAIVEKILRTYPDLSAEWLLTGSGDVLKTEGINGIIEKKESNSKAQNISPENNVPVPISVNSCPICPERERTIKALKMALDAKQDEVDALRRHLVDKERLIQLLTKSDDRINKQTG